MLDATVINHVTAYTAAISEEWEVHNDVFSQDCVTCNIDYSSKDSHVCNTEGFSVTQAMMDGMQKTKEMTEVLLRGRGYST